MTWGILWALILGFALSAIVQAVVRRETITRLMGDDKPRTLVVSAGLGAASSSCSAWLTRSATTNDASALSSAITRNSVGPASESMPVRPRTLRFGAAT